MTSAAATEPQAASTRKCDPKVDAERAQLLPAAKQVLDRSGWWGFKVESVLKQAR